MMIEQVNMWRADDGSFHETEGQAVVHSRTLAVAEFITEANLSLNSILHPNATYNVAKTLIAGGWINPAKFGDIGMPPVAPAKTLSDDTLPLTEKWPEEPRESLFKPDTLGNIDLRRTWKKCEPGCPCLRHAENRELARLNSGQ